MATTKPKGPELDEAGTTETDDAALGIGQDEPVADFTTSPLFQKAVNDAVMSALQTMGAPQAQAAPADWAEFMESMKSLASSMNEQRAGYNKPLTPEELTSRKDGEREFFRLIEGAKDAVEDHGRRRAREMDLIPYYIVGPGSFYGQGVNGEELFSPGQPVYLTLPPPEDFEPLNEAAGAIMAAQQKWHGEEPMDIAERVAKANMRAKGQDPDNDDRVTLRRAREVAEVNENAARVSVGPKRIMGTTVKEARGENGRGGFKMTSGDVHRPVSGPVFVEN